MKGIFRLYLIETFSLFLVSSVTSGIIFEYGIQTLLLAGLGLTATSSVAKPVINLLLLPLNLMTFGLFRFISSAVALYLVTLVVPGFKLVNFYFQGFSSKWIDLPSLSFEGIVAFIAFSILLSILTTFLHWLIK
jgi:putative membrane protein